MTRKQKSDSTLEILTKIRDLHFNDFINWNNRYESYWIFSLGLTIGFFGNLAATYLFTMSENIPILRHLLGILGVIFFMIFSALIVRQYNKVGKESDNAHNRLLTSNVHIEEYIHNTSKKKIKKYK